MSILCFFFKVTISPSLDNLYLVPRIGHCDLFPNFFPFYCSQHKPYVQIPLGLGLLQLKGNLNINTLVFIDYFLCSEGEILFLEIQNEAPLILFLYSWYKTPHVL